MYIHTIYIHTMKGVTFASIGGSGTTWLLNFKLGILNNASASASVKFQVSRSRSDARTTVSVSVTTAE